MAVEYEPEIDWEDDDDVDWEFMQDSELLDESRFSLSLPSDEQDYF